MSVSDQERKKTWPFRTKNLWQDHHEEIIKLVEDNHNMTGKKHREKNLQQLSKAIEAMQIGVTISDLDGNILYTNPAEAKMHGYTVADLIGKDLGIFAPSEFRNPMTREQIKALKTLRESVNIRKGGNIFPVKLMSDVVKDDAGQPIAVVTTCEDITEYKQASEKLQQHTRELLLLNHMNEALQACDSEEKTYSVIVDVCKKLFPSDSGCLSISNLSDATMNIVDFWGEPPRVSHTIPLDSLKIPHNMSSSLACADLRPLCPHQIYSPYNECLGVPIMASGEILGLLSLCFPQCEPGDSGERCDQERDPKEYVLNRISGYYALTLANLRLREKLRRESILDPLTSLYNRRYMKDSLKREAYRAKRRNISVGLIMLDIDHFKNFNDLYGHKAGDFVLRELGAFLMTHVRGGDIACRYGGEEFLLILPEAALEVSRQRAEELRREITYLPLIYQETPFHITVSLGVAALPDHGQDIMHIVHQADMALYQAKARGRNQVAIATTGKVIDIV